MESEGFAIYDAMMQLKNEVIPSYYSCILLVIFSILVAVMIFACTGGLELHRNVSRLAIVLWWRCISRGGL